MPDWIRVRDEDQDTQPSEELGKRQRKQVVYNEEVTEKQFLKTIVESGQEDSSSEEGEPELKRPREDSERKTYDEEYGHVHVPVRRPGRRGRPPKHRKEYHKEPVHNGFESSLGEQGVETFDSAKQMEAE